MDLEGENFRLRLKLFELEQHQKVPSFHPPAHDLHPALIEEEVLDKDTLLNRARDVVKHLEAELTSALGALSTSQASLLRAEEEARGAAATTRAEVANRRALESECEVLRGEVLRQRESLASEQAGMIEMSKSLEDAQAQCAAASVQLAETTATAESLSQQCSELREALAKVTSRAEEAEQEGEMSLIKSEAQWDERLKRCTEQLAGALERGSMWERELVKLREMYLTAEAGERNAKVALNELKRDAGMTLARLEEELNDVQGELRETSAALVAARERAKKCAEESEAAVSEATAARIRATTAEALVAGEKECGRLREAAGRDALGRWLSLVSGKFAGLLHGSGSAGGMGSMSTGASSSSLLNPEDTAGVLKALDELPNVHAWFSTATSNLVRQMEGRTGTVHSVIDTLGTRLRGLEEEAAGSLKVWRDREAAAFSAMKAAEGRLAAAVERAEASEKRAREAEEALSREKLSQNTTPPVVKERVEKGGAHPQNFNSSNSKYGDDKDEQAHSLLAATLDENKTLRERLSLALKRLEHARAFSIPSSVKSNMEREVAGAIAAVAEADAVVRASRAHKEKVEKWRAGALGSVPAINQAPSPKWLAELKESIYRESASAEACALAAAKTAAAVKAHVDSLLTIALAAAGELTQPPPSLAYRQQQPKIFSEAVGISPPRSLIYLSQRPPADHQAPTSMRPTNPIPSLQKLAQSGAMRAAIRQSAFTTPAPANHLGVIATSVGVRKSSMMEFAARLSSVVENSTARGAEVASNSGLAPGMGGALRVEGSEFESNVEDDEAWTKRHSETRENLEKMLTQLDYNRERQGTSV